MSNTSLTPWIVCELERSGRSRMIDSDNGGEFTSNAILALSRELRRMAPLRAGQIDAEWLCEELQRAACEERAIIEDGRINYTTNRSPDGFITRAIGTKLEQSLFINEGV